MTLGTEQGVTDLCKNTDSALIARTLTKARADTTSILLAEGLTTPETDEVLDTAVEALASKLIGIGPGAVNPRTGFTVEGFSRRDGTVSQLKEWQDLADASIKRYIASLNASAVPLPRSTTS